MGNIQTAASAAFSWQEMQALKFERLYKKNCAVISRVYEFISLFLYIGAIGVFFFFQNNSLDQEVNSYLLMN